MPHTSRMLGGMKRFSAVALFALSCLSQAQWSDVKNLGTGGESYVSVDGKGNVYATCHNPSKLFVSHDFGATFETGLDLPDSFCDVTSTVGPDGKLYVVYLKPGVKGIQVVTSSDTGKTIAKAGSHDGPYDREWIVVHPKTGEVGFDYSDGYIGGPKSKGVYYAASKDGGMSFERISRIDREPEGSYAVDPYLTVGSEGRLYAAWAYSTDYDHIAGYRCAASEDGGKTWSIPFTLATAHAEFGDTQERWMLGSILAIGPDTVMGIYQDYAVLDVDGQEMRPLLAYYRLSKDGGKTWSKAKACLSANEITSAMKSFNAKGRDLRSTVPNYMQTLPWVAADPKGRVHMAFVDNRVGQTFVSGKTVGQWHVRLATWDPAKDAFGTSEAVSHTWAAERPPLDFIGCAADAKNVYVTWTENPNKVGGWDFTGNFFFARKSMP